MSETALRRAVIGDGTGLWRDIRVVPVTGSTNADIAAAARDGAPEGLVVVAEEQSAGRGRLGRTWTSGLFFSVLLRPGARGTEIPGTRWGWLPLLAGTAVRTAVERITGVPVRLKWPNDLVIPAEETSASDAPDAADAAAYGAYGAGRKLAGILVERIETPEGAAAVLGIGLNVSLRADELPAPHATSIALEGTEHADRDPILRAVLRDLERWYLDWSAAAGDPMASGLSSAYAASCATLGTRVRVVLPTGRTAEGPAVALDADGRLVVRTDAGEETFSAGDVMHLR